PREERAKPLRRRGLAAERGETDDPARVGVLGELVALEGRAAGEGGAGLPRPGEAEEPRGGDLERSSRAGGMTVEEPLGRERRGRRRRSFRLRPPPLGVEGHLHQRRRGDLHRLVELTDLLSIFARLDVGEDRGEVRRISRRDDPYVVVEDLARV